MEDLERAEAAYAAAVFGGDIDAAARLLDSLSGDGPSYDVMRGKLRHCANLADRVEDAEELALFTRAEAAFHAVGDTRGEAEAVFWQGCYHQVLAGDDTSARPLLERSARLARAAGDDLVVSYALRHLGISSHIAGDLDGAERDLQESTALRRRLGFTAGVAANLVGLAYVAVGRGDVAEGARRATEAGRLARLCGAATIRQQADEALTAAAAD